MQIYSTTKEFIVSSVTDRPQPAGDAPAMIAAAVQVSLSPVSERAVCYGTSVHNRLFNAIQSHMRDEGKITH